MRIGILACDILKPELEYLTADDPDIVMKKYLEYALHVNPAHMKEVILDEAKLFRGKVDVLFLGYAVCNSLENITAEIRVPTVMLKGCDCIEAILGPDEYEAEKKICTGTWFNTPGWAMEGTQGLIKEMHLDALEGVEPEFIFSIIFGSYQRVLFLDTGIGDEERYCELSKKFADELKLGHDRRKCNLSRIQNALAEAKGLAASLEGNDVQTRSWHPGAPRVRMCGDTDRSPGR